MCRIENKCLVKQGGVVDNRKLLQEMANKTKPNLMTRTTDKKILPEVQSVQHDKKKRKREDNKEEITVSNTASVQKRKKLTRKNEDNKQNVGHVGLRSSSSSCMDKTVGGGKIKWEPWLPVDGLQGGVSSLRQAGRGGSTARITGFFESLGRHQTGQGVGTDVLCTQECTVGRGELANGRGLATTSGLVRAGPGLEPTLTGLSQQPMGEGSTSEPRD